MGDNEFNKFVKDAAAYFGAEAEDQEIKELGADRAALAQGGAVILRDGDRALKLDADEYAAVYAATFGDFDVGVNSRTHRTALPKLAASATRLGKVDLARSLDQFGRSAAECIRVEDESGKPWEPGQPLQQERATAGATDDQGLVADVEAYFAGQEPAPR